MVWYYKNIRRSLPIEALLNSLALLPYNSNNLPQTDTGFIDWLAHRRDVANVRRDPMQKSVGALLDEFLKDS